jgi:protein FAM50
MSHANFHRPDTGINTIEGNVAGPRAAQLAKKRQQEQSEFEAKKLKIVHDAARASGGMDSKFAGAERASRAEQAFRVKTVGLVTAEEFIRAQQAEAAPDDDVVAVAKGPSEKELDSQRKLERKNKQQKLKQRKKLLSTLSFAHDDEVMDEPTVVTQKPSLKDPAVDTSFLPDKQRDQQRELERLRLEQEWKNQQDIIRQELLQITYSYWDGSGHRRSVTVKKGDTIGVFLELVRKDLCNEFREMQAIACDALIYVKEDLMLPQDVTFYDLIVTKARGKSGPLFHFDVHDDVRLGPLDSRVEKDESHPGKVVARQWYDRNKHIFPASRWELYDPTKTYGNYTIHGGEVNKGDGKKK